MHLREGEQILKVYHHHPTPYVFHVLKVMGGAFPFFLLLYIFQSAMSAKVFFIVNLVVFGLFALVLVYVSLLFWLDKLIITDLRVVFINWKYLTLRDEAEALLDDIQDVRTKEKGILSTFGFFDYGTLRLETASSHVTIEFFDAPDPEGMRKFLYHVKKQ